MQTPNQFSQDDHVHESELDSEKNVKFLLSQMKNYVKQHVYASNRKIRLEKLMRRKSTNKLKQAKIAQSVRRLVASNTQLEEAAAMLQQLEQKLSQLGVEVSVTQR